MAHLEIDVQSSLFQPRDGLFRCSVKCLELQCTHILTPEPLDQIRLAKMAHSAEATAQKGRASPTDTATSALGGCVVVSGEHVTGTRKVFDTSLETPEVHGTGL